LRTVSPSQKPRPNAKKKPPALGHSQAKPWVRVVVVLIVVGLGLGSVAALVFRGGGSGTSVTAGGSSTTQSSVASTPALASAAGKPCVAVAGPLPAGAPQVPITVGPPPTQLITRDLQVGTGATVQAASTITLDYIGVLCSTGKILDTTYGKQPLTNPVAQFIPGWQQGIVGMKVGGTRLLGIPPALAYGAQGAPPDIAPDETLWFVVQVKAVQ
jgi:peptidylprolyl isomerase